ncbi:hypothetical protein [Intestinibacter sp.]|uniref:hypothetical protein n=1 Tax=Intestinibacter sp. TaxID=1965304 RepID=UPI003F1869C1
MIENVYDIISDYKQIERNVKNIVENILSDEDIPLLIRADILIKYKEDNSEEYDGLYTKCTTIYQVLNTLSDPKLTDCELEALYKLLEMFVRDRITKYYEFTYE